MARYDFRHGTLARRRAEAKVARHNAVKAERALPAPARAQNLAGVLQVLSDVQLVGVLSGGIDFEACLRKELADRGLDLNGQWVGFPEAEALFDTWAAGRSGSHQGTGL